MRNLNREEVAWAAGFFDGEGHARADVRLATGRMTVGRTVPRLRLTVSQTDPRVLRRFQTAVGSLGAMRGPYSYKGGNPVWYWQAASFEHAQAIIVMLWRWLSPVKREQARRALATLQEYHQK